MIGVNLTQEALGYKYWKTLGQCINMDTNKEYFFQSPFLFKNIPDFVDSEVISECWKYFKSAHTNLAKEQLKDDTLQRLKKGADDPIVNFYMTHIEPLFNMFINCVQANASKIDFDTSMIIRFTFSKINSDELIICVTPGGKWWTLRLPTDKQKMANWFTSLMKDNHYGRCMMFSIYKVTHPPKFHNIKESDKESI
jgi:hypothetical protein